VKEVFGFVKRNLSGAKRRKDATSGERGAGKGASALVPAQHTGAPERVSAPIAGGAQLRLARICMNRIN